MCPVWEVFSYPEDITVILLFCRLGALFCLPHWEVQFTWNRFLCSYEVSVFLFLSIPYGYLVHAIWLSSLHHLLSRSFFVFCSSMTPLSLLISIWVSLFLVSQSIVFFYPSTSLHYLKDYVVLYLPEQALGCLQ